MKYKIIIYEIKVNGNFLYCRLFYDSINNVPHRIGQAAQEWSDGICANYVNGIRMDTYYIK